MPDAKYSDASYSKKYSGADDYWQVCQKALTWMQGEAGELKINSKGIAEKGLLIRHLVLPNNIAGSFKILDFIGQKVSKNSYVNIMDQYRPCYKACDYLEIDRSITPAEFKKVKDYAARIGLSRGF
jgi:putative pyruvate formate lyase activating enzyme